MTIDLAHPAVSVEMLSRLFDQVPSALLAVDVAGRIIVMNAEAETTLGVPVADCLGARIADEAVQTPELGVMARILQSCLDSPRTLRRQTATVGSGEGARTIGYTTAPLYHEDGSAEGAVAVFTDLTDVQAGARNKAEKECLSQVGRVASWMAHEVKNPLATIQMYAQLCSRTEGPEHQDSVRVIREQVSLAQSRISDVLRSLSLQSDETRTFAVADLGQVVRRYVERETPGLPHVTFEIGLDEGSHYVPLVPEDALSIVSNLLTNAAEAMETPGTIRVRLRSEGGSTILVVEDSGPGFPDKDPQRLLQPFFTTKKRATGLGLWTVKRISDAASGALSLENTEEGGGRVTLSLPNLGVRDLIGKTVLVVEDDPNLRRLLRRQLQAFGTESEEASGGRQAAEFLKDHDVDVIVTDMHMPGGGGRELLQHVPEQTPVLLISGAAEAEDIRPSRKGIAFLMKPFAAEDLGLALSYLLWETSH